jgi:hypothetical protein
MGHRLLASKGLPYSAPTAETSHGLTPVNAWRDALDLEESAVEIGDIIEPDFVADVGHLSVRTHQ